MTIITYPAGDTLLILVNPSVPAPSLFWNALLEVVISSETSDKMVMELLDSESPEKTFRKIFESVITSKDKAPLTESNRKSRVVTALLHHAR